MIVDVVISGYLPVTQTDTGMRSLAMLPKPNKLKLNKKFQPFPVDAGDELFPNGITANLSAPIILAEIAPGRFNIIDGNHRAERAHREGVEKIPAYRVSAADHQAFLTSERSYKAYIEYWNSKVESR